MVFLGFGDVFTEGDEGLVCMGVQPRERSGRGGMPEGFRVMPWGFVGPGRADAPGSQSPHR